MKLSPLIILATVAACAGTGSTGGDGTRDLASGERIPEIPGPVSVHASGFSTVVVTVDASAAAGVGEIPAGSHVQLGGGALHVDGHGSVDLRVRSLKDLKVTGHSSIVVQCLDGGALEAEVSGQSSLELSGTLDSLDARVTGGSALTGRFLTVTDVTQDAQGHSTIDLTGATGEEPSCAPEGGTGGSGGDGTGGSGGAPLG